MIFGAYAQSMTEDVSAIDLNRTASLFRSIRNNYPDMLPTMATNSAKRLALEKYGMAKPPGVFLHDITMAAVPVDFDNVVIALGRKLACALHYKHIGAIIRKDQFIFVHWTQAQIPNSEAFLRKLVGMMTYRVSTRRPNLSNCGQFFRYAYAISETEALFAFVAIFGNGLAVWGVVSDQCWDSTNNFGRENAITVLS